MSNRRDIYVSLLLSFGSRSIEFSIASVKDFLRFPLELVKRRDVTDRAVEPLGIVVFDKLRDESDRVVE